MEALAEKLLVQFPNMSSFDINNVPASMQQAVLDLIVQPDYMGCLHIRSMIKYPDLYDMDTNITQWLVTLHCCVCVVVLSSSYIGLWLHILISCGTTTAATRHITMS